MMCELLIGDMFCEHNGNYEVVVVSCDGSKGEIHSAMRHVKDIVGFPLSAIIANEYGNIAAPKVEHLTKLGIDIQQYVKYEHDGYKIHQTDIKQLIVDVLNYVNPRLNLAVVEFDSICIPGVGHKMY